MFSAIKKRLECFYLDFLAIPALFMTKKGNAEYHLKYICPKCPNYRREMRDVDNDKTCWWNKNWKMEHYDIPRSYGVRNWISQYVFLKTDLDLFRNSRRFKKYLGLTSKKDGFLKRMWKRITSSLP